MGLELCPNIGIEMQMTISLRNQPKHSIFWVARCFLISLLLYSPNDTTAQTIANPDGIWAAILSDYVDSHGRTNFKALAREPSALTSYVDYLADHGPLSQAGKYDTKEKVLAYYINAYNALAMHGVIERGVPKDFDSVFKRVSFFKFRKVNIDGMRISLSALENEIIRPIGDPRIHFALNCMVKDCPRLPTKPFTAENIDTQLEQASIEFFSSEKHLKLDKAERAVYVSAILDFYTQDFAPNKTTQELIAFINRYRQDAIDDEWRVHFMDYDWTVNQQPAR